MGLGFDGRIAVNGCPSGRVGERVARLRLVASMSFDTSNDPVTYTGSAITDAAGRVTTGEECVVIGFGSTRSSNGPERPADIWISQIAAAPAPGDVITGSWSIGDDGGSWTLTRTN